MTYDPFDPFNEVPDIMYNDYFLKFTDQAEADAVLFDEQHDGEGYNKVPKYAAIDVIGTIYKPTGKMLKAKKGEEPAPETAPLEGWHANVRHTAEAPELDAYKVTPQNPVRGWA
jgi:hypothetical protein